MPQPPGRRPRGRGADENPKNRFEACQRIALAEDAADDGSERQTRTMLLRDASKTVIARNDSPDVGFNASINPYRGCEHGCIYCYARPTHEYLGFSAGLDFESKILVKENAPVLLRAALADTSWCPQVIAMSGVTDAYQPIERRLKLTRACLEVLAEFRNPVAIITKNHLVTRDVDLLAALAGHDAAAVMVSVTTLDPALHRIMEPRASRPAMRLEAIGVLARAGIPVGVNVAPVIPGLTDEEIPAIVAAAAQAAAHFAGMQPVRLPHGVKDLFSDWLSTHLPDRKDKVLNRIRALRGNLLNDPRFGQRMRGQGIFADQIAKLFELACRRHGMARTMPSLSISHFRRAEQLPLF